MEKEELIYALKAELRFLNSGGYRKGIGWRPYAIFEESPLCINPAHTNRPAACEKCPLLAFVPENKKHEEIPCRHIPLNDLGLTPKNLPQWGNRDEMESAVRKWLEATIQQLEDGPQQSLSTSHQADPGKDSGR